LPVIAADDHMLWLPGYGESRETCHWLTPFGHVRRYAYSSSRSIESDPIDRADRSSLTPLIELLLATFDATPIHPPDQSSLTPLIVQIDRV
jgi:hypothetical protein